MKAESIPASGEALAMRSFEACRDSGLKRQFGRPAGLLGRLVGRLMARKNRRMNEAVVESLTVHPGDRVLEVGFGPGVAIGLVARRVGDGFVAGVDVSGVMVAQARRRNRRFVRSGTVALEQGSAAALSFPDGSFDRVLAVNTLHHWSDPSGSLREARRVLRAGGTLCLGLRRALESPRRLAPPGYTDEEIGRLLETLRAVGFQEVRVEDHEVGRRIACVLAVR